MTQMEDDGQLSSVTLMHLERMAPTLTGSARVSFIPIQIIYSHWAPEGIPRGFPGQSTHSLQVYTHSSTLA